MGRPGQIRVFPERIAPWFVAFQRNYHAWGSLERVMYVSCGIGTQRVCDKRGEIRASLRK